MTAINVNDSQQGNALRERGSAQFSIARRAFGKTCKSTESSVTQLWIVSCANGRVGVVCEKRRMHA